MKLFLTAILMAMAVCTVDGKPMTESVSSWQGVFKLNSTNTPIRFKELPAIILWRYDLPGSEGGTAIGFSAENGDMLLMPTPTEKGVQPIFADYMVTMPATNVADILVRYSVQGTGGWKVVEDYRYNGKKIDKVSETLNSGKRDFKWFKWMDDPGQPATFSGVPNPLFAEVTQRLKPIISHLSPDQVEIIPEAADLTVSYQTQNYKIHGGSMTGEFSKEAHNETGPTFKGFILTIQVQPKGEINQAVTPQTLRRPYWQTYIQVTPLAGSDKQLYWGLSYGSRTDTNLLARIMQAVEGMATEAKAPVESVKGVPHSVP